MEQLTPKLEAAADMSSLGELTAETVIENMV